MAMWALAMAAFVDPGLHARPLPATFDLRETVKASARPAKSRKPAVRPAKRRSPYLLPAAELPPTETRDIQVRWKLRKVKLTMALPSI